MTSYSTYKLSVRAPGERSATAICLRWAETKEALVEEKVDLFQQKPGSYHDLSLYIHDNLSWFMSWFIMVYVVIYPTLGTWRFFQLKLCFMEHKGEGKCWRQWPSNHPTAQQKTIVKWELRWDDGECCCAAVGIKMLVKSCEIPKNPHEFWGFTGPESEKSLRQRAFHLASCSSGDDQPQNRPRIGVISTLD